MKRLLGRLNAVRAVASALSPNGQTKPAAFAASPAAAFPIFGTTLEDTLVNDERRASCLAATPAIPTTTPTASAASPVSASALAPASSATPASLSPTAATTPAPLPSHAADASESASTATNAGVLPASLPTSAHTVDNPAFIQSPARPPLLPGLPVFLQRCLQFLESDNGLTTQGLFRIAGSAKAVKLVRDEIVKSGDIWFAPHPEIDMVTVVASLLKQWIRDLKDGIVPKEHFAAFLDAADSPAKLQEAVANLPTAHRAALDYLCGFLVRLAALSDVNKMTTGNIAIVFGPTVFRCPSDCATPLASTPATASTSPAMAQSPPSELFVQESMSTNRMMKALLDRYDAVFEGAASTSASLLGSTHNGTRPRIADLGGSAASGSAAQSPSAHNPISLPKSQGLFRDQAELSNQGRSISPTSIESGYSTPDYQQPTTSPATAVQEQAIQHLVQGSVGAILFGKLPQERSRVIIDDPTAKPSEVLSGPNGGIGDTYTSISPANRTLISDGVILTDSQIRGAQQQLADELNSRFAHMRSSRTNGPDRHSPTRKQPAPLIPPARPPPLPPALLIASDAQPLAIMPSERRTSPTSGLASSPLESDSKKTSSTRHRDKGVARHKTTHGNERDSHRSPAGGRMGMAREVPMAADEALSFSRTTTDVVTMPDPNGHSDASTQPAALADAYAKAPSPRTDAGSHPMSSLSRKSHLARSAASLMTIRVPPSRPAPPPPVQLMRQSNGGDVVSAFHGNDDSGAGGLASYSETNLRDRGNAASSTLGLDKSSAEDMASCLISKIEMPTIVSLSDQSLNGGQASLNDSFNVQLISMGEESMAISTGHPQSKHPFSQDLAASTAQSPQTPHFMIQKTQVPPISGSGSGSGPAAADQTRSKFGSGPNLSHGRKNSALMMPISPIALTPMSATAISPLSSGRSNVPNSPIETGLHGIGGSPATAVTSIQRGRSVREARREKMRDTEQPQPLQLLPPTSRTPRSINLDGQPLSKEDIKRIKEEYKTLQERIHRARASGSNDADSKREHQRYRELKEIIRDLQKRQLASDGSGSALSGGNLHSTSPSTPVDVTSPDLIQSPKTPTASTAPPVEQQQAGPAQQAFDRLAQLRRDAGRPAEVEHMTAQQVKQEKSAVKAELAQLKSMYINTKLVAGKGNASARLSGNKAGSSEITAEEKIVMKMLFSWYCELKNRYEGLAQIASPTATTSVQNGVLPETVPAGSVSVAMPDSAKLEFDDARYKSMRHEKKRLQVQLHDYQTRFLKQNGRAALTNEDWAPVKADYKHYKALRNDLEELERNRPPKAS
ncbi:hypothetical protein BC831DRAFT_506328 [Entophlyctis helioformis]|nr:hypothetical protein BC831DRAFT_506328 [Entophlyctis helioformis]